MKLNELTRYYEFEPDILTVAKDEVGQSQYNLIDKLENLGWNKVGNRSSYSDVFVNASKPYILKINKEPDRAFAWFAFLTRRFPNIHFPRIGNMKVYKTSPKSTKKYYIYLIEKLEEISNSYTYASNWRNDVRLFSSYVWGRCDIEELKNTEGDLGREKLFIDALTILKENKNEFRVDLHNENLMQRTDGTIVIIDPYAS